VSPAPRTPPTRALALLTAVLAAGCLRYPQRVPGPLYLPEGAEPSTPAPVGPDAETARTAQTATVQRNSDPVWVRRPGERDDYPLYFHRKRERLAPGSMVRTGASGRAELLWSPDATAIVLFDEARVSLGDPERDEPLVRFHSVTHALLTLTPEDRVQLPGGARLRGDPEEPTGTILLERASDEILRVTNQSKRLIEIRFRTSALEVSPGESIDLPQLTAGSDPLEPGADPERLGLPGLPIESRGKVADDGAGGLTAVDPTELTALGVRAHLEPGQRARFSGLTQVPPAAPADASAPPNAPKP